MKKNYFPTQIQNPREVSIKQFKTAPESNPKALNLDLSHQKILQKALDMMGLTNRESSLSVEVPEFQENHHDIEFGRKINSMCDRGVEIVDETKVTEKKRVERPETRENVEFEHVKDQCNVLDGRIERFKLENKHRMQAKMNSGMERITRVFDTILREIYFDKLLKYGGRLIEKENMLFDSDFFYKARGKSMRHYWFRTWRERMTDKKVGEAKNHKASNFRNLQTRLKMKMVIQKARKVLKQEKKNGLRMQMALFKKVYFEPVFSELNYHTRYQAMIDHKLGIKVLKETLPAIKDVLSEEKRYVREQEVRLLKKKSFMCLRNYKNWRKKRARDLDKALDHLIFALQDKSFKILKSKVAKHK